MVQRQPRTRGKNQLYDEKIAGTSEMVRPTLFFFHMLAPIPSDRTEWSLANGLQYVDFKVIF